MVTGAAGSTGSEIVRQLVRFNPAVLIREKVFSRNKSVVLCNGSISGVDINRFKPDRQKRMAVIL